MLQPIATWNPARGVWETQTANLMCGHLVPYSETWPTSGMTRRGTAYALPTSVHHTTASACSSSPLLKTPTAQLAMNGGSQHPDKHRKDGHDPTLDEVEHLLPTPTASDSHPATDQRDPIRRRHLGKQVQIGDVVRLLPTPQVADQKGGGPVEKRIARGRQVMLREVALSIGDRTNSLSDDGNTSSDVPLPLLELWGHEEELS